MIERTCRLVTLGCKVNQYETQLVKEALQQNGFREAAEDEPADLCEVMDWMASRLGVAKPPRRTREDAGQFTGKRCRNTELKASGYRFEYRNYRLGYNDLLARTP